MKPVFNIQIGRTIAISLLLLSSCHNSNNECDVVRKWEVKDFTIVKKRCPDLVLANYYEYSVYNNDNLISNNSRQVDSCVFTCQAAKESFLILNICNNTVEELKPHKVPLNTTSIDSIIMYSNELKKTRSLTSLQIEQFAKDWNNSKVRGYSNIPFDSAFSALPAFQYKLTVFSKGTSRPFYGYNYVILDSSNWEFEMNEGDLSYFRNYWHSPQKN